MNKIKKLSILILFLLALSINVFAATNCEESYGSEGFSCMTGNKTQLENNNNECKSGRACNNNQDFCCGTSDNLWCCKPKTTVASSIQINFIEIADETSNVGNLIENYINLVVTGVGYKALREKTTDQNLGVKALYDEAYGYKQIAVLRREFLGVPESELARQASGVVGTSVGTGRAAAAGTTPAEPIEFEPTTIEESIESYKQRANSMTIRSNVLVSNDYKYTTRNVAKFKFFNGKWYWGEGNDDPEDSVSRVTSPKNPVEQLAYSLRSASFSEGIVLITNWASGKQHKISVVKDDETFTAYTEFSESNLRQLIEDAIKNTRATYSDTTESYELEVYNDNFFIDDVVYFVYKDSKWQYKVRRDNDFSEYGDMIGNTRDIRIRPPSDFHRDLIRDVIGNDYAEGIRIIATRVNSEGSSVRIHGMEKLPRDGENHISKDELGIEAKRK